jgi:hypothetical protein
MCLANWLNLAIGFVILLAEMFFEHLYSDAMRNGISESPSIIAILGLPIFLYISGS